MFGREDYGLSNDALSLCHFYSSIQAHFDNPVFNLFQNASSERTLIYNRYLGAKRKKWLASLRVLRTERASEIRSFQEAFAQSNVNELMLKVA